MLDHLWAAIAFLALAGWAFTNVMHTKAGVSLANSFAILEKMDARMDDRIHSIIERARARSEKAPPTQPLSGNPNEKPTNPMAELFGGASTPLIPILEQPEAGMEIAE